MGCKLTVLIAPKPLGAGVGGRPGTHEVLPGLRHVYADPGSGGGTTAYSSENASASLVVTSLNDAVTAVADNDTAVEAGGVANGTAGSNPSGNVLANDIDVDSGDTLTVTGVAAGTVSSASGTVATAVTGTYGSMNIAADGSYTYSVDNNNPIVQALRTSGQTVTDTFTYTVQDSGGTFSSTQVTITIQGQNDAPVAVADNTTATEAGGLNNDNAGSNPTGNVLSNDTDVDAGDTKIIYGVAAGTVGSASGSSAASGPPASRLRVIWSRISAGSVASARFT